MTQRITIELDPYEHADARVVAATTKRLGERVRRLVAGGVSGEIQAVRVIVEDETVWSRHWRDWR